MVRFFSKEGKSPSPSRWSLPKVSPSPPVPRSLLKVPPIPPPRHPELCRKLMIFQLFLKESCSHAAWHSKCAAEPRHDLGGCRIKQVSKSAYFKWFGAFFEDPFWGANLDHEHAKSVPMQRGARSFFDEVFSCSAAIVF